MSKEVDFEKNVLSLGGPQGLSPHTGHCTGHAAVVVKSLLSACGEFSFSNDSSGLLSVWPPCIHRETDASGPHIRISSSVEGSARCAGGTAGPSPSDARSTCYKADEKPFPLLPASPQLFIVFLLSSTEQ